MQRAIIVGLALVCVCLVFAISGPSAQRIAPSSGAAATRPAQVEVTNFPAVQAVSGSVNVGNLPAMQTVGGSVAISNLPVDADGNLRVAGSPRIHFVGFTLPVSLSVNHWLEGSRDCAAEFPGSRLCTVEEFYRSIPIPPPFPIQTQGTGWARMFGRHPDTSELAFPDVPNLACLRGDGELEANACQNISGLTETPFACCGY